MSILKQDEVLCSFSIDGVLLPLDACRTDYSLDRLSTYDFLSEHLRSCDTGDWFDYLDVEECGFTPQLGIYNLQIIDTTSSTPDSEPYEFEVHLTLTSSLDLPSS